MKWSRLKQILGLKRTFFFVEKHDVYTSTRRPQLSSMFIPCSHGQLQRNVYMHFIELEHDCLLTWFFFQFLSLRITLFVLLSTFTVAAYVMVCSWLGVVRAMMFNRGILFYSKWPFVQSQRISKKSNLFSLVNSSSLGWVIAKRECSRKVQRGARMLWQRRAGQLV